MTGDSRAFLYCAACAASMAALFDFFDCVRFKVIKAAAVDFLMDTVWWITAAVVIGICLWESNSFSLRMYEAVGAAIGLISYRLILHRALKCLFCFVLGIIVKIFCIIFKIIKRILKILLTPALFLYKILIRSVINSRQGGKR